MLLLAPVDIDCHTPHWVEVHDLMGRLSVQPDTLQVHSYSRALSPLPNLKKTPWMVTLKDECSTLSSMKSWKLTKTEKEICNLVLSIPSHLYLEGSLSHVPLWWMFFYPQERSTTHLDFERRLMEKAWILAVKPHFKSFSVESSVDISKMILTGDVVKLNLWESSEMAKIRASDGLCLFDRKNYVKSS